VAAKYDLEVIDVDVAIRCGGGLEVMETIVLEGADLGAPAVGDRLLVSDVYDAVHVNVTDERAHEDLGVTDLIDGDGIPQRVGQGRASSDVIEPHAKAVLRCGAYPQARYRFDREVGQCSGASCAGASGSGAKDAAGHSDFALALGRLTERLPGGVEECTLLNRQRDDGRVVHNVELKRAETRPLRDAVDALQDLERATAQEEGGLAGILEYDGLIYRLGGAFRRLLLY
jgi:hypothetical protein